MRWRAAALACVVMGLAGSLDARQPAARSPRNASYTLEVRLEPLARRIEGRGQLTWRNLASIPAPELRFHLYWNAWRSASSSWLRQQALGRDPSLAGWPATDRSAIDLTALALLSDEGRQDLLPRARYIAPDDGNPDDQTVLAVPLDRPVAPGETIVVEFAWTARVPRTHARTGALGNFFFVAQWFPKIGVFQDDGWHCRQFHAATEFFADFGVYDVRLTVPRRWIVGASGREQARVDEANGEWTTHRYLAEDVHDFAWTTSPDFVDISEPFDVAGLPPVTIRLLLQPEHRAQADRHFAATRAALQHFGTWFGAYPYDHLTVVDPVTIVNPRAQGGSAGGMEYPTLFTAGTRKLAPRHVPQPEDVTIHEAGHQFWHGIVATNEVDHAWMDEALTTYATARVIDAAFPGRFVSQTRYFGGFVPWTWRDIRWSREVHGDRLAFYLRTPGWDPPARLTWQYWPGTAVSTTYVKSALWLHTLERLLGWDTMRRGLAEYFARGAFRHPDPAEFFDSLAQASGQDLTWFVDAVYRSASTFDYAVEQVTHADVADGAREATVVVRRRGSGAFPVDVRVTFADGSNVVERWDGREEWRLFRYRRAAQVATVAVDPDRVLLLDLDVTNNTWTAQPRAGDAANRWSLRWLVWLQQQLLTYAFVS